MRSYLIRMGPKSKLICTFIRGEDAGTPREGSHVKTKEEVGESYKSRKTKDSGSHQEAKRGKEEFFPSDFRGTMAQMAPKFWIYILQNCERMHFC